jgi:glycosyltransferase involved in cell wall biosynthesis
MAAGRPVVATDVGGAREAIVHGESGFLIAAGDDEGMAEHITSLLLQPELARSMGECGKRIVTEKFSSQKQLQNVESLYSELLKSSVSLCTQSTQTNVVKEHK